MVYNLTNFTDATNFASILTAVNTLSGGVLGIILLVAVWLFVFMGVQDVNRVKAATASFITVIAGGLFTILGLVSPAVMWIAGFILALSLVLLYVNARD